MRRQSLTKTPYNPNQVDPRGLCSTKGCGRPRVSSASVEESRYRERREAILSRAKYRNGGVS